MPTEIKVTSRVGWSSNDYRITIEGNKVTMIYEKSKGVPEVLDKMNKEGMNATMIDSKTITRTIPDATEEEIVLSSKQELDAVVAASHWPIKFSYKEVTL